MKPCKVCGQATEDDGYGEPVHAETNRYWHGDKTYFPDNNGHVATV